MKSAIGYVRVSTEDQAREGVSLEAQEARLRAYAVAQGLGEIEVRVEAGRSAKSIEGRPVLQSILEAIARGEVRALLVLKLDRLARNVRDALDIADLCRGKGTRLVSLSETIDTGSAMGEFTFTLLAALAALERRQIGERTKMALTHKKSRRESYAPTPLGFRRDGDRLVTDEAEQAVVARIRDLRAQGLALREIAGRLEADVVPTKTGGRWHASTVAYILKNDIYSAAQAA
jgi:site-specific DNA recombinase